MQQHDQEVEAEEREASGDHIGQGEGGIKTQEQDEEEEEEVEEEEERRRKRRQQEKACGDPRMVKRRQQGRKV